ncbi:MAG: aminoacyl-tRNA hydrolase [Candidatus Omnitrophota bacterium]
MKLIIGLGNPGEEYSLTRHNIGFLAAGHFAGANRIKLKYNKRFNSFTGEGLVGSDSVYLALPQAFMNLSGHPVRGIVNWLNIETNDLLVILDDISLPFGSLRIRPKGSDAGHKGLGSVIDCLATDEVPRMRVGIMGDRKVMDLSRYVLARFTKAEQKKMPGILETVSRACECWLCQDINVAMNKFNTRRTE